MMILDKPKYILRKWIQNRDFESADFLTTFVIFVVILIFITTSWDNKQHNIQVSKAINDVKHLIQLQRNSYIFNNSYLSQSELRQVRYITGDGYRYQLRQNSNAPNELYIYAMPDNVGELPPITAKVFYNVHETESGQTYRDWQSFYCVGDAGKDPVSLANIYTENDCPSN
nr:hypothetical protein [uncultured Flavobacterium sp.]